MRLATCPLPETEDPESAHHAWMRAAWIAAAGAVRGDRYKTCLADRSLWVNGEEYPKISNDFDAQVRYFRMRLQGQSHNMAEVLATRAFPGVKTDTVFMRGYCNGNQFEQQPELGDFYAGEAAKAGVSTTGKVYLSQLAEFPGDPQAWVSGRGDIERVCRERGYGCTGLVEVEKPKYAGGPVEDLPIAPDIVSEEVDRLMEEDPSQNRADLEEKVYQLRAGLIDPNPLLVQEPPPGSCDDIDFT